MAGIFLSWSAPDVAAVDELKRLLGGLGMPIWEYRDEMLVGEQIHATVFDAIEESIAAIICFTDETADKPWIQRELDWAYAVYGKDTTRILPVWIGAHPQNRRPSLVNELKISAGDLTSLEGRERFVNTVLPAILSLPVPLIVPAALFAMDKRRSETLFEELRASEEALKPEFLSLCNVLGMPVPPAGDPELVKKRLMEQWSRRYGPTTEDFSPFADTQRLVDVVQSTVDDANVIRRKDHHRPVFLRWMHNELRGVDGAEKRWAARDRWRDGRPLLIVDSISTLDMSLMNTINGLPDLKTKSGEPEARSAILWIPPYTLHTNALESLLRESASHVARIGDAFRDWSRQSEQQLTFDSPTSLSVRLWLHRTFVGLHDDNPPLESRVSSVQGEIGGPRTLRGMTTLPRQVPS
ncbi:MAG TPA: toll/interleukin-1 receptor domain-containing protein, partial [Thermoanaerobaculia bacterium]